MKAGAFVLVLSFVAGPARGRPYLLFAPDETVDLSTVVFNTEAHLLKRTW